MPRSRPGSRSAPQFRERRPAGRPQAAGLVARRAAFAIRLRGQVDLDTPTDELLAVVSHTTQPTRGDVGLRPQGR